MKFEICGVLFLGVTFGMVFAVVPYPQLVRLFKRLPLPGIDRPGNEDGPESQLKVVISAW